ncbi:MAG: glycerol-3-phosphate 1-O-acyltransferase PlsY [Acidiferrobacterales bacterium]|nr:glycerol-3-phosphate 1-O-acyltransferase PlsY [Acidiferrobacterales bacterium]
MQVFLSLLTAYLVGSISSAIVVCKLLRLPDPRRSGSNNPGATNVLRLGGKGAAALTLSGDIAKGTVPVVAAQIVLHEPAAVGAAMLGAFLGHLYPLYFGFKGGKGVATAMGAYLGLGAPVIIGVGGVWLVVAAICRYSSVSSILAMLSAPAFVWILIGNPLITAASAVIFVFVAVRHRSNIQRLRAGGESKIKLRRS